MAYPWSSQLPRSSWLKALPYKWKTGKLCCAIILTDKWCFHLEQNLARNCEKRGERRGGEREGLFMSWLNHCHSQTSHRSWEPKVRISGNEIWGHSWISAFRCRNQPAWVTVSDWSPQCLILFAPPVQILAFSCGKMLYGKSLTLIQTFSPH
jgi:hypothetical protein